VKNILVMSQYICFSCRGSYTKLPGKVEAKKGKPNYDWNDTLQASKLLEMSTTMSAQTLVCIDTGPILH
jgi:hypothetical protein